MKRKELDTLDMYAVSLENDKIEEVIKHTLKYYVKRALVNKFLFIALSIITITLNAGIPVINQIKWDGSRLLVTIISSIASVITGIIALLGVKDVWFRYRSYAELLKSECIKFNSGIPPYDKKSRKEMIHLFITNYDNMYLSERKLWELQMKQNKLDDSIQSHNSDNSGNNSNNE
jgi:hypothetical protein